jgi:phosphoglycolate phosphatase
MKKKIAAFDLDGTLLDAYAAVAEAFNYALEKLGYPSISRETLKRSVGKGDVNLAGRFVKESEIPRLLSLYKENQMKFYEGRIKLMDGCLELLDFLKGKNFMLGVATNRSEYAVGALLEELNIKQYFDIICTADSVKNPKPHPDMLFRIMEFCGSKDKDEMFFAGDMDIDYLTGRNAGVDTYILLTGSSLREELENLDDINLFDNLVTLKKYLTEKI